MSEHRHGQIGVCERCGAVRALAAQGLCFSCQRGDEEEVARLVSAWGRDLDLLERFDAFCAARLP